MTVDRARGEEYVCQKIELSLMYTCGYKRYCVRKGIGDFVISVLTLPHFRNIACDLNQGMKRSYAPNRE